MFVKRDMQKVAQRDLRSNFRNPTFVFSKEAHSPPKNMPRNVNEDVSLKSVSSLENVSWKDSESERLLISKTSIASDAVQTPRAKIISFIVEGVVMDRQDTQKTISSVLDGAI